ncbi:uncharacterized protein BT62DRAFT_1080296 [Guyanagaster necrorhizus]|uniref:Uncharacterized protein n=1 Tax=Guyanagaster necrorhizus TaxID=856835 RepID=A0A9P7VHF7_9AGAR|nr:uncharacterized protein BT62DRAFT_1080296 [Guyanagaster necrorhizus MCA 3950]KAG7441103.1 hypothetical protein BT62DRAFT_1080296 [Guyanagaster necrorhizus MCA 3950]
MLFVPPARLDRDYPKRTQVALREEFQDILRSDDHIFDEAGECDAVENSHNGNLLLKQLWGECADLRPDIGFTTNRDVVMVFFRVVPLHDPEQNTSSDTRSSRRRQPEPTPDPNSGFVLSPFMKWTDKRLRACLLALSLMALDEESWMTRDNPVSLRDLSVQILSAHKFCSLERRLLALSLSLEHR